MKQLVSVPPDAAAVRLQPETLERLPIVAASRPENGGLILPN